MSRTTQKADQAERLLKNTLLKEAFEEIEKNITAKWKATKFDHKDARETLYTQLRCLENVKSFLRLAVEHGKKERLTAEIEQSIKEKP